MPSNADVSILIPAYEAEAFIDRTLLFARGQTHRAVEILISIDLGTDRTADRARAHAAADQRVRVFDQTTRLGWTGNVNFLLDQVRTPFCFLYFHDDILLPQYAETMRNALAAAANAASAQCDMVFFGASTGTATGRAFAGDRTQRLLTFMLAPYRGAPLRAMMRTDMLADVRFPSGADLPGFLANEPYLMELVAAGPMLYVPDPLYLRWNYRPAGLTDSWRLLPGEVLISAMQANVDRALSTLARSTDSNTREAVRLACWLWTAPHIVNAEQRIGSALIASASDLHSAFADLPGPSVFTPFAAEIAAWGEQRYSDACAYFAERAQA